MAGGPATELRESVTLLLREWWLFVGGLLGVLCYGGWVLASGVVFRRVTPLASVRTVAGFAIDAATVFAVLAWLVLPALVAVALVERRLQNASGNLVDDYRLDHPSVLLAIPGLVLLGCLAATVTVGESTAVVAVALVASVHLLVRTVAYGYRVYTLSLPRLFSALLFLTAATLAGGALVQMAALSGPVGEWVANAGVDTVVRTQLPAAGIDPASVPGLVVAVPAVLASAYLLLQLVAGSVVRLRAPLEDPNRRAGQRFPIMPPVSTGAGGGGDGAVAVDDGPANDAVDDATAATDDDRSQTRVFSPNAPLADERRPEVDGAGVADDAVSPDDEASAGRDPADEASDDTGTESEESTEGWMDDTAVFTADAAGTAPDQCPDCGREIPLETTVTFCPNCGERLEE